MMHPTSSLTPEITFIKSNKNQRLVAINGYMYVRNKSTSKITYWTCIVKTCLAGVHISLQDQFDKFTKSEHNHLPVPERIEIRKMMSKVKARVNTETTAIGQIYHEELAKANLSKSALAVVATARIANSGLNKKRRKTTPILPSSVDFDIPLKYKMTTTGERYLLADRVQRCEDEITQRIIVFATDEQLRTLFTSSHILMDGTFDSTPSHFHQIYSIHALKNDHSFVCVIALLGGQSSIIYKELFSILTKHADRLDLAFRPEKITSDFEPALIKTIAEVMPNSRHIGCNFHFVNALYRQMQRLGLTTPYQDDESVRSTVRKLMGLSLVPFETIEPAFKLIASEAPSSTKPLIQYFNAYWMTKIKWTLWNVSDVEIKTNNVVEGWNHHFNRLVAKYHPNVWTLFEALQKEEVAVRQQILKMIMGEKKIKNKKTIELQEKISSSRSLFYQNQITLPELLTGLSLLVGTSK
ncbi:unnamed protein product [Adineta steineri]|uniref:MULE transposase domain-containing protein n=1 Tax=Adineta steineri TaxID=433720 RepID=A0A813S2D4_9BILA|nr:unnamed protein product [Adineta steineri]